jgi:hypothetical protein
MKTCVFMDRGCGQGRCTRCTWNCERWAIEGRNGVTARDAGTRMNRDRRLRWRYRKRMRKRKAIGYSGAQERKMKWEGESGA